MVNNGSEKALVQRNANYNKITMQAGINSLDTKPYYVIEVFLQN
jgi:hypothetical protein